MSNKVTNFFKDAFNDMKEGAKSQHEVDKVNFEAAKMEAKATFEENKFKNSLARAKEDAKKNWDAAHINNEARKEASSTKHDKELKSAKEKLEAATTRYENAKQ